MLDLLLSGMGGVSEMKDAMTIQEALNNAIRDCAAWEAAALAVQYERDALAAQVKALKDLAEFWINQAKPFQPSEQEYKTWLALGYESKALRSSPQQHLAKIRAEAGVAGLRHGVMLASEMNVKPDSVLLQCWCDGYAATVRKGGAE